jgi:hypothetical protein
MSLTFPSVLCDIGHRLTGAEETLAVEDAISPLDHVRLAAFTNNIERISCKPPVLQCDSMVPGALFTYNEANDQRILKGNKNIHSIGGLHVVGGAIMHTRTARFAVSLLYGHKSKAVLVHAGGVSIACLEAELYDSAFDADEKWESVILGSEKGEFMKWRKEAATEVRLDGLSKTPKYLLGNDCYHVLRYGVTSLLSLRAPENGHEWSMVMQRLVADLKVLPGGDPKLMEQSEHHTSIVTGFMARSDYELPVGRETVVPSAEERKQKAESLVENAVLTWLAYIVLRNASDDAFDQQDEPMSEVHSGIRRLSSHTSVLQDSGSKEASFQSRAKGATVTELESFEETGFTLPSVMHGMNRLYTTKAICPVKEATGNTVMESVALEVFGPEDTKHVTESSGSRCAPNITPNSAISVLGKCLAEDQAILVVSREPDGRIVNAKLVGHDVVVPNVNKDAMRRMILFPWVTVVIVDSDRVSLLLIKDPNNDAAHSCFSRQPLKLRESAKPRSSGSSDVTEFKGEMEAMKKEMTELSQANNALMSAVKEFERKLNYCVESRADAPAGVPSFQRHILSEAAAVTMGSLKRTFEAISSFEKRARV